MATKSFIQSARKHRHIRNNGEAVNKAIIFRNSVLVPVIRRLGAGGAAAEELLLGTAIQESMNFRYRKQIGGGPALGFFQMEPSTHDDIWKNYLRYRKGLADNISSFLPKGTADKLHELEVNDKYAAAMARAHYMRVQNPLPKAGDIAAQANYWKQYYNTPLGRGKPHEYLEKWEQYVSNV